MLILSLLMDNWSLKTKTLIKDLNDIYKNAQKEANLLWNKVKEISDVSQYK